MSARKKLNNKIRQRLAELPAAMLTEDERKERLAAVCAIPGVTITGRQALRILTTGRL